MSPKKINYETSKDVSRFKFGVCEKVTQKNQILHETCIDGKTIQKTSKKEHCELIKTEASLEKMCGENDLIKFYNDHEKEMEQFQKITGFDFARGNYKIKNMSFYIWNLMRDQKFTFDGCNQEEEIWTQNSKRCGIQYKKLGKYKHKVVHYDINKYYTSILMSRNTILPKGSPIKRKISQNDVDKYNNFYYGLYKCKIIPPKGELLENYSFYENKNNMYTHFELKLAKKLGFKIKLLSNEFLHYKDKFKASTLFNNFFNRLLPHSKNIMVKRVMNTLWGLLGSKNRIKKDVDLKKQTATCKDIDVEKNSFLIQDHVLSSDYTFKRVEMTNEIENQNKERLFKYNACRVTPFITAIGRCKMTNVLQKYVNDVVWIHTDGFIAKCSKGLIEDLKDSKKIGEFKIEGVYKGVKIKKNEFPYKFYS